MADPSLTPTERVNPAALAVEDAARALGLPVDAIRQDIAQGAPTNADGSVNLVHYAAWLNRELAARAGGAEAADLSAEAKRSADGH